jgi:hypothetical protein
MSEQKKYTGKKRQKIFTIEKYHIKQIPKKLTKKKINIYSIDNIFPSEEIPIQNNNKIYLNLDEGSVNIYQETAKHSLIGISKLVFEYLKNVTYTTGNEVTEHIKNKLQLKKKCQINQKNIQRRVYDAINVMCAVGLIHKNKQKIQFLNKNLKEKEINNSSDDSNSSNSNEQKIKLKLIELEEKRKKLVKNYLTMKFYEKYYLMNEKNPQRKSENKIEFPFDIIKYDNSSPIKITSSEDLSRYLLLSNSEFIHMTPYDIIKKLISQEILLKINKKTNDIIDSKTNSKNNSLIDEFNCNRFNEEKEEKEEKKYEEFPKKNKSHQKSHSHFKYINNIDENIITKEKEVDFVFEYLKDKKCFIEELVNNNDIQVKEIKGEINDMDNKLEEQENDSEKEKENEFIILTENQFRKNNNMSYGANYYDESPIKKYNDDLMYEIETFK